MFNTDIMSGIKSMILVMKGERAYHNILTSVSSEEAALTQSWTCWLHSRRAASEKSKFMLTDFRFVALVNYVFVCSANVKDML